MNNKLFHSQINRIVLLISLIFTLLTNSNSLFSQNKYYLQGMEMILDTLMQDMYSFKADNERFLANEKFISELEDALSMEKSFFYAFEKLNKISILTSKDKQFRIITWSLQDDNGSFENYGFIQSKNNQTLEYETYRLFDKGEDLPEIENVKLSDSTWLGAVYYELIENKYDNKTYYILLGKDGNDIYSRKRVIEPISFKQNSGRPIFGQNVFYKQKERMRYVFEYSTDASFTLGYDVQYYDIVSNQKAKSTIFHKAQPFEKQPNQTLKEKMIFFDDLEPIIGGMEGFFQYYVPSGEVIGLYFEKGKWKQIKYNILPRNKADKLDSYAPDDTKSYRLFPEKTKQ